jgi:hypothetical protein
MLPVRLGNRLRLVGSVLASAAVIAALACSSARQATVSTNPELIQQEEIAQYIRSGTTNLFELIQRARPRWLEKRSDRSLRLETVILVYHNQQRLGGIETLRELRPENVVRIRRLDAARAGLLPGARDDHVESAIVVETAR